MWSRRRGFHPPYKAEIEVAVCLNKYLPGTKFESGKSVWELYESNDHDGIRTRVLNEVQSTHRCYELIKCDFDKFKALELSHKKREKLAGKILSESGSVVAIS